MEAENGVMQPVALGHLRPQEAGEARRTLHWSLQTGQGPAPPGS